jgi:hypothetical protein
MHSKEVKVRQFGFDRLPRQPAGKVNCCMTFPVKKLLTINCTFSATDTRIDTDQS